MKDNQYKSSDLKSKSWQYERYSNAEQAAKAC